MAKYGTRFGRLGKQIELGVNNVVKAVAIAVDQTVVASTPVDTGRARSNWIVTLNSPNTGTIDTYGKDAVEAAKAQGESVINKRLLGQSIHITNNLPYIKPLETGTSSQRPNGFVKQSISAGVATARAKAPGIIRRAVRSGR